MANKTNMPKERGSLEELQDLLEEFDTAMLITATEEGEIRSRPMAVQLPREGITDCDLFFVTGEESAKVEEIERDRHVGVCCYRSSDKAWISISAVARTVRDRDELKRVWRPEWSAWLPGGPDHANAALLKLRVVRAQYWEATGGRARVLFDELKAVVTGESAASHTEPVKEVGAPKRRVA